MYSLVAIPQLESIAQLTPIATAPPPGTVLATALEPRFTVAASLSRSDGSTAATISQVVTRLASTAAAMAAAQGRLIAARLRHTAPYEAKRGSAKPKAPPMTANESTPASSRRDDRVRRAPGGWVRMSLLGHVLP
jgi:hypothetical protein